ncbi:MAG: metallophosphoesterase [Candidatus Thermoplasmatota archaeon]|jgi:putative SbcD/Mre11-related phosphoesterase|nr:metallophosphoesterase [Candidatus Thermoplasmatota archaeon]
MQKINIQPIPNSPALFVKEKKILVIADLHIGIESELNQKGINMFSQTDKIKKHFFSLCKKYKPKEIILLGDIKHNIPVTTIQERKDVKNFLEEIQSLGCIHIIPGNHDGSIQKITPKNIVIHSSNGFIVQNIAFIHGHKWPTEETMDCKQIIMGHTHPTIMFIDRLCFKTFEPCWIKSNFDIKKLKEKYPHSKNPEILIMPAFNPLCGGIAANNDGITGPLGKIIDIENAFVFLIDGTFLGKIKDIK